jgi:hypothetical protein
MKDLVQQKMFAGAKTNEVYNKKGRTNCGNGPFKQYCF